MNIAFIKETFGLPAAMGRELSLPGGLRETSFLYLFHLALNMAKKEGGGGFQSSAGLMRYFDSENDKAPKISPRVVVGLAIGAVITVILLNTFLPM